MRRFVVLRHEPGPAGPRALHWDLMLECEAGLRTWALDELPHSGRAVAATPLPDHRVGYLDYEGAVSGDRGSVSRYDAGTYTVVEETDGTLVVELCGELLSGRLEIREPAGQRCSVGFVAG